MTPEDAFLDDIREHPDDDTPRLIFSDWLEDNGDVDRAEFIRSQVYYARHDRNSPVALELCDRASALLQANWERWVAPMGKLQLGGSTSWHWTNTGFRSDSIQRFPRGFVESMDSATERLVEVAPRLFAMQPIRHLTLRYVGICGVRLRDCQQLEWIESMIFNDYAVAPMDALTMQAMADCQYLQRLGLLGLYNNHLGDEGARWLARAPWLANVRWLILDDNGLSDVGVRALAHPVSSFCPSRLHLSRNPIGDQGAFALAHSPHMRGLRRLAVANCGLTRVGIDALINSPQMQELRELEASDNRLTQRDRGLLRDDRSGARGSLLLRT